MPPKRGSDDDDGDAADYVAIEAKARYRERRTTARTNTTFLVALLVGLAALAAVFGVYATLVTKHMRAQPEWQGTPHFDALLRAIPIVAGVLALLPALSILGRSVRSAASGDKSTRLVLVARLLKVALFVGIVGAGVVVPIVAMKTVFRPAANADRKEKLTKAIRSVLAGMALLLVVNVFVLRRVLFGAAMLASMSGRVGMSVAALSAGVGGWAVLEPFLESSLSSSPSLSERVAELSAEERAALLTALTDNVRQNGDGSWSSS